MQRLYYLVRFVLYCLYFADLMTNKPLQEVLYMVLVAGNFLNAVSLFKYCMSVLTVNKSIYIPVFCTCLGYFKIKHLNEIEE